MINEPINVEDEEFEEKVLNAELPVVVDFWATWCGPCKMIHPILETIAKEKAGKIIIAKIDTDKNQKWAIKYGVQGIPTMLFIYKGKILYRQTGALPKSVLTQIVDEFLGITNT